MSFISKLDQTIGQGSSESKKPITMNDIATCKGSGNFAVRALNVLHLGLTEGKWVTDTKVKEFIANHFDHLDDISNAFQEHGRLDTISGDKTFSAAEKNDQKLAMTLSKVFEKAAHQSKNNNDVDKPKLEGFQNTLKTDRIINVGVKSLEKYSDNPSLLVRAAYFENAPKNDIKGAFVEFLKTYEHSVHDDSAIKTAYKDFIKTTVANCLSPDKTLSDASLKQMRTFDNDKSTTLYLQFRADDKMNLSKVINNLGLNLQKGKQEFDRGNYAAARVLFKNEIYAKDAEAQLHLGDMYHHGKEIPQDLNQAAKYYRAAANLGNVEANYHLGVLNTNPEKALELYTLAADQGHAPAMYSLGLLYAKNKNKDKALEYFNLASDHGNAGAQNHLGEIYMAGRGVQKDVKQAFTYFKLSADQGNATAQKYLGEYYLIGSAKDYKQAAEFFKLSADQGDASAQLRLGEMYFLGRGVVKDKKLALEYYKLAADQGNVDARNRLRKLTAN